jgi:hypothetical protein
MKKKSGRYSPSLWRLSKTNWSRIRVLHGYQIINDLSIRVRRPEYTANSTYEKVLSM